MRTPTVSEYCYKKKRKGEGEKEEENRKKGKEKKSTGKLTALSTHITDQSITFYPNLTSKSTFLQ